MTLIYNTSTTSKRSIWPAEASNLWVVNAQEDMLKLSNGIMYVDWAAGLGAVTLGYKAHFLTKSAVSLPWIAEEQLAKMFCTEMQTEAVRFFRTGSDAMSCAVRLSRGFTKRPQVIVFDKCYHGTGDWFGPALWTQGGIVDRGNLVVLPFGQEIASEKRLGKVAAIVVEPVPKCVELPPAGWLQHLRTLCDQHGILLISDEVVLGYRYTLQGYMAAQGVRYDLAAYGKAMGQGIAISACTGRLAVMKLLEDKVHFSGTNNGELTGLWAAHDTLLAYGDQNVCAVLTAKGIHLRTMLLTKGFQTRGLDQRFEVVFASEEEKKSAVKWCFQHGILFPGFCCMMTAHTDKHMQQLVDTLTLWRKAQ